MNANGTVALIGPDGQWADVVNMIARVKVPGGSWGPATTLGRFAPTAYYDWITDPTERVAVTDDGKVVALWSSTTDGIGRFLTSRVWTRTGTTTSGAWAPERRLYTGSSNDIDIFGGLRVDKPGSVTAYWFDGAEQQFETTLPGNSPPTPSGPREYVLTSPVAPYRGLAPAITAGAITARIRPTPDSAFGAPIAVSDPNREHRGLVAELDEQGNGYLASVDVPTGRLEIFGYDPVAPSLTSLNVPSSAKVGSAVAFSVVPVDRMANPRPNWKFGDGTSTNDSTVSHVYAKAGTYTVTVSATDEAGNTATATRTIVVSAPALPKLDARPALWTPSYANGRTLVRTLELYDLKAGDTVRLACSGTGCTADGTRTFTVSAATARLITYLNGQTGMSLATGATFKVTVSRSGSQAQTATFTMQSGKAPTKVISY